MTKVNLHKKYTAQNWSNCVSVLMHTMKCTTKNVEQCTPSTKIWIFARQICTLRCICTPEFRVCTPITPTMRAMHAEDLPRFGRPFQTGFCMGMCGNLQITSNICYPHAKFHHLVVPTQTTVVGTRPHAKLPPSVGL